MTDDIDIDHLRGWIGRGEEATDIITPRLADSFHATLDQPRNPAREGDVAPLAVHWCLAPPIVPVRETGPDGHPARGGFLPPVPLPRRMWAGGELRLEAPLHVGETVMRVSRIENVVLKEGSTGRLCFVTVRHEIRSRTGATAISERQDIVYRDGGGTSAGAKSEAGSAGPVAEASREIEASALMLFRYSALTFNGHRIHYDRPYAREVEHYPGLVVHGPLQATLLLHLGSEMLGGATKATFGYRGVRPLFDGPMSVNGRRGENGLALWSSGADGIPRMTAEIRI